MPIALADKSALSITSSARRDNVRLPNLTEQALATGRADVAAHAFDLGRSSMFSRPSLRSRIHARRAFDSES